jgi:hypothetical protein
MSSPWRRESQNRISVNLLDIRHGIALLLARPAGLSSVYSSTGGGGALLAARVDPASFRAAVASNLRELAPAQRKIAELQEGHLTQGGLRH